MALSFQEWTSTPTNFVSDLKTKILTSTDWANPSGDIVQATTTRGANLAINLSKASATNYKATFEIYRSGTSTDPITRYFNYTRSGSSSSSVLHCTLSVWKEGLYLYVEGPRVGETGVDDATYGSIGSSFALVDIVPYHTADTEETVCCVGSTDSANGGSEQFHCHVGRNVDATRVWDSAYLASVDRVTAQYDGSNLGGGRHLQAYCATDDKVYLFPYLVIENRDGLRGRLNDIYFAGWSSLNYTYESGLAVGQEVTYDSKTFVILPAARGSYTTKNFNAFGSVYNYYPNNAATPLVAVRKT